MHEELGKIESVFFGKESHGILSFMIHIDLDKGGGQGFGGFALDDYDKEKKRRVGCAAGGDLILQLLNLFNVNELDKIKGRPVYALYEKEGWGETVIGLRVPGFDKQTDHSGKFLIKDWQEEWFHDVERD